MEWMKRAAELALRKLRLYQEAYAVSGSLAGAKPLPSVDEIAWDEADLWGRIRLAQENGQMVPYERLCSTLMLDGGGACALGLAVACATDPLLLPWMQQLTGCEGVTLQLAMAVQQNYERLLYMKEELEDTEGLLLQWEQQYEALCKVFILPFSTAPFFCRPLSADDRLVSYLYGTQRLDHALESLAQHIRWDAPSERLYGDAAPQRLAELIDALRPRPGLTLPCMVQLLGAPQMGKKLLLRHALHQIQQDMLFVDAQTLSALSADERYFAAQRIAREMLLGEQGVCFYHLDGSCLPTLEETKAFLTQFVKPLLSQPLPICLCTDEKTALIPYLTHYIKGITIAAPDCAERIALWEGLCKEAGLHSLVDCSNVGNKFALSPHEIALAVSRLHRVHNQGKQITPAAVMQVCTQVLPLPATGNLRLTQSGYTLEDLKLPPHQLQTIQNICDHVRYRHQVYDLWQLKQRYPYGRNVSALFVGAPGTGKTMAAHVISDMLNIPLYKIDLSQVVDKYIGETEKRLEEIFTLSEKSNAILFFDEADSIFGKRTEVGDAKDKYANTEVSYVLQRIEQYDGIVLMASNYRKNIDDAFMRRIRYVMEFSMPDAKLRKEIWESNFTDRVPLEEIDFDYLSQQFELSGGSIKNIVLNSVFLAAGQNTAVKMKHILESVRNERSKQGQTMAAQDFGTYSGLM